MSARRQIRLAGAFAVMVALLGQVAPSPAHAQERHLFGARDFEMDWQLEPGGRILRLRFLAAQRRLRIEMLDGSDQVMLRDLAKGDVVVLVAGGAKGAYGTKVAPMAAFRPEAIGETREIAGETCRDFTIQGQVLCVSDDGIPLAVEFGAGRLMARKLLRQGQHPALFELPKGTALKPMPGESADKVPKLPF